MKHLLSFDDDSKDIAAFFGDQIKGPQVVKRSEYQCSRCKEEGHNTRSCTAPLGEVEEAGVAIVPGKYVVVQCPFSVCGKHAEYERERNSFR